MNRRGFLSTLVAGLVLDPERLLWVPGKRLISIPKLDILEDLNAFIGYLVLTRQKPAKPIYMKSFDNWFDRRDVELLST